MNFALFLVMNALLLIRPEELFPAIEGSRLYLITTFLCTVTSLGQLGELLSFESLRNRPITVCVLLIFAASIISPLVLGQITEAMLGFGPQNGKVLLYYLLMISIINDAQRFRTFVISLVLLITALVAIAVTQTLGLINVKGITPVMQRETNPITGEDYSIPRMVSSGIFNDPNDLCLILGLGIVTCIYGATTTPQGLLGRILWLLPIPLFVYSLLETHSRGGLLGVLAGCAGYLFSIYGGAKAAAYAGAGIASVLVIIGGRQGNISGGGTAHERLMLWAGGLRDLFARPLYIPTGLGEGWCQQNLGLVAHNSFVQAYVENGVLGGGAFLAAFYLGGRLLLRLGQDATDSGSWAIPARHFGFAALAGYATGCFSLTRNFTLTTFLTLGIAAILLETARPTLPERFQVTRIWFRWLALFSICGLFLMKLATQGLGIFGI